MSQPDGPVARPGLGRTVRIAGAVLAVAAVALCVRALASSWGEARSSIADAGPGWLALAAACAALAMVGLGLTWWRCLALFGAATPVATALAWYFGAELGKYLPGGVWTALGRGELASRGRRVPRGVSYVTTLVSYGGMCAAAAATCGVLAPVAVAVDDRPGWLAAAVLLVPLAAGVTHPRLVGVVLTAARRIGRERVVLDVPKWRALVLMTVGGVPAWLLYGAAAAACAQAVGAGDAPTRVALAAIVAWTAGFVVAPVPAGAGVRELVFVGLCGLPSPEGVVVAVLLRVLLIVVDVVAGVLGLVGSVRAAASRVADE